MSGIVRTAILRRFTGRLRIWRGEQVLPCLRRPEHQRRSAQAWKRPETYLIGVDFKMGVDHSLWPRGLDIQYQTHGCARAAGASVPYRPKAACFRYMLSAASLRGHYIPVRPIRANPVAVYRNGRDSTMCGGSWGRQGRPLTASNRRTFGLGFPREQERPLGHGGFRG